MQFAKENDVNLPIRETDSAGRRVLALSDGRAGNVAMAEGLARAIAREAGWRAEAATVDPPPLLVHLPPRLWSMLPASLALRQAAVPEAGIVVGAGRRVAPLVAALERTGAARGVQVLDSGIPPSRFAAVVAPEHDGLAGPGVIATTGSVNRITPALLDRAREAWHAVFAPLARPRIAVLIGGTTKRRALDPARFARMVDDLGALSRATGGSAIVTASRRTGAENVARLRAALPDAWIWDGTGDNPYAGMLAWADAILVTDDSVNMASEAASTPAPVMLYPLLGESGKLARFHRSLIGKGAAMPFDGTLPTRAGAPLDETARAARAVLARLGIAP